MLHAWIGRPHVAQWWGKAGTVEALQAEYLGPEADSGTRAFIVLLGGEPIGFIQSYVAMNSGGGWWPDEADPGVRGIDQFLADGQRLGQGLGSAMVRAFVQTLFADPSVDSGSVDDGSFDYAGPRVTRVQTDPDPRNLRAIRSYEKAGFHAVRELDTPDGQVLLMICDRPEPSDSAIRT